MNYAVEDVPNDDDLYKWIPRSKFDDDGRPEPGVFVHKGESMSTSWERYSTAEECRNRSNRPAAAGVVRLSAGSVRAIKLAVGHTPRDWDRSHTDVKGIKDPEVQVKLARMAGVAIAPDPPKVADSQLKKMASHGTRATVVDMAAARSRKKI